MNLLPAITGLLICQLIGTAVQLAFHLPVPGAVLGMVLLFAVLLVRKSPPREIDRAAKLLLRYLPLLFVPAGVGVIDQFGLIGKEWLPLSVTLVATLVATIAFTGVVMQMCLKSSGKISDKISGKANRPSP